MVNLSRNLLGNISKTINKKEINQIAFASEFIKRTSSKISGFQFLTTLLIASANSEHSSLEHMSDLFRSQFRISIRAQSIMESLNKESTANFLKNVFEAILKTQYDQPTKKISPSLFTNFSKILIQDSTRCDLNQKGSGGRAGKASLKLDVIYDFKIKKIV